MLNISNSSTDIFAKQESSLKIIIKSQNQYQLPLLILVENGTADLDFTYGFNSENFMKLMLLEDICQFPMKILGDWSEQF